MPSTNTVSADGKYIIQKVVGDINSGLALKYNHESHALGHELGINRYLVDLTESHNVESVLGNYEFAYDKMPASAGVDLDAVVALVVEPDDHSHDFVETVARNAGLNVTLFRDRDVAIQHLLSE
jgi:hypothetical protein